MSRIRSASGKGKSDTLRQRYSFDYNDDLFPQIQGTNIPVPENVQREQKFRSGLDSRILSRAGKIHGSSRVQDSGPESSSDVQNSNQKNASGVLRNHIDFWTNSGFTEDHSHGIRKPKTASNDKQMRKLMKRNEELGSITEQYRLIINSNPHKHVMLLQYPDRVDGQLYCNAMSQKPLEIRIKPKCGLIEVDIPLTINKNYNVKKGHRYGSAMRSSEYSKERNISSHARKSQRRTAGLDRNVEVEMHNSVAEHDENSDPNEESLSEASDVIAGGARGRKLRTEQSLRAGKTPIEVHSETEENIKEDEIMVDIEDDSEDALDERQLMDRFTLSGHIIPFMEGDPVYMIATFHEDVCTWTKVDAIISLRAQFSHLDALGAQERMSLRLKNEIGDVGERRQQKESKAQDVNLRIKETEDPETADMQYGGIPETLKLLQAMEDEPWQPLEWIDQDDQRADATFDDALLSQAAPTPPHLVSSMTNEQYLDALSCPRIDPIKQGQNIMASTESDLESTGYENGASDNDKESSNGDWFAPESDHPVEAERSEETDIKTKSGQGQRADGRKVMWQNGIEYALRPKGKPQDREMEVRVEQICRLICLEPTEQREDFRAWLQTQKEKDPNFAFLNPTDYSHHYFLWRLLENQQGRGIPPAYDVPQEIQTRRKGTGGARRGGRKPARGRRG